MRTLSTGLISLVLVSLCFNAIAGANNETNKRIATTLLNNAFTVYEVDGKVINLVVQRHDSSAFRCREASLRGVAKISLNGQEEKIKWRITCYKETLDWGYSGNIQFPPTPSLLKAFKEDSPVEGAIVDCASCPWGFELKYRISYDPSEQYKHKYKEGHVSSASNHDNKSDGLKYKLTVNVIPQNAKIKIMNIRQKYKPGIDLTKGKYEIYVSHPDYQDYRTWIEIIDHDFSFNVELRSK